MAGTIEKNFASDRSWDFIFIAILMLLPLLFATFIIDLWFIGFENVRYYLFGFLDNQGYHSFFEPISPYSILPTGLWVLSMGNSIMIFLFFPKNQNKLRMKKHLKISVLILSAVLIQFIMIWAFSTAENIILGSGFWVYFAIAIYLFVRLRNLRKNEL